MNDAIIFLGVNDLQKHAILNAKSLGFNHPSIDKDVFFDSEIAEDMQQLIEKWRGYAKHQNSAERNQ